MQQWEYMSLSCQTDSEGWFWVIRINNNVLGENEYINLNDYLSEAGKKGWEIITNDSQFFDNAKIEYFPFLLMEKDLLRNLYSKFSSITNSLQSKSAHLVAALPYTFNPGGTIYWILVFEVKEYGPFPVQRIILKRPLNAD